MAALKAKKAQSTITKSKALTQPRWERDWRTVFLTRDTKSPATKAQLGYIADIMMEWVKHSPKLYSFKTFLNYQNTVLDSFFDLLKRSEKLNKCYRITLQILADNRELAALERNPEGVAFKHLQGLYDHQWKAQELYFNQLKQDIAAKSASVTFIPVVPNVKELEGMAHDHDKAQCRREDLAKELSAETLPDTDSKGAGGAEV